MIIVTWNQLLAGSISSQTTTLIEQKLTGAYQQYGLDTPINVSDILTYCGAQTAIYALDCLLPITLGIEQAAGFDMINAWLSIWNTYLPTNQIMSHLLADTLTLQAGIAMLPVSLNACGDVVSTLSGITESSVLAEAANLQSFVQSLPQTMQDPGQFATMQCDPNNPQVPFLITPNGTPVTTANFIYSPEFIPVPTFLPGYITHPLKEIDPNTGLLVFRADLIQAEDQAFQAYQKAHPGNIVPYVTCRINPNYTPGTIDNYANLAVYYFGMAVVSQAISIATGTPLLSTISQYINQAVQNYALDQIQNIQDIQYELLQLYGGSVPIESIYDYANTNSIAQQLSEIESSTRVALINDYAFWESYDVDLSGSLSMTERVAAEIGLNNAVMIAIQQASLTLYNNVSSQINAYSSISSNIGSILQPYLL